MPLKFRFKCCICIIYYYSDSEFLQILFLYDQVNYWVAVGLCFLVIHTPCSMLCASYMWVDLQLFKIKNMNVYM